MKTKIMSILCIIVLVFTTISQSTLADNVTQNSTPSTSTNVLDGEDFTQGEKTTYNNGTTLDTSESTEVYVSQSSTFAAMIPKVIILGGQNGLATYEVYAKGNIGGTENIYIVPQTTLQLHDVKNIKFSLNGTITQEKTSFSWDDVMNEQKSIAQGTILVNGITAGNWISSFNFSISLEDTRTHIETISLTDSTIVNEDTNAIQIQSSSNKEIPISIYPANSVDVLEATSSSPYVSVVIEEIEVSPTTKTNTLIENLLLTNNVFAENENTKNIKLKVQVDEDAPCNLNATITLKSRTKVLEIPILVEHTYDNGVITQESNCVTNGIKMFTCTKCNHVRYDETTAEGHVLNDTFTIDIEPTCMTNGEKSIHCTLCDYKEQITSIEMISHNYVGVITKQATCTEDGVKTFTCSICQNFYTETIAKTNHTIVNGLCTICGFVSIKTLNYTGGVQSYTIPNDGYYKLETWGAQGGGTQWYGTVGGFGGYSFGTAFLQKNTILYIYVGGQGVIGKSHDNTWLSSAGGYNGGGRSGNANGNNGGGGGGATDIRINGTNLTNRILVAGGGGGASWYYNGGAGNGTTTNSTLLTGSNGADNYWNTVGGGGGGYYGGSVDSGGGTISAIAGRGYGGSGYIGTLSNANMSTGINSGNGRATITFIGN